MSMYLNQSINASTKFAIWEDVSLEPFPVSVLRLVFFGILFVMALVGNACVFTATWRNPKLRTFSYSLITCLALGDFISTLALPFMLVTERLGSNWIFGNFLCVLLNPTQVVCGMVTTNVHMGIAAERYVSVLYPFKGKPEGLRKWLIVALVWFTAIICALPAFATTQVKEYYLHEEETINLCVEIFPKHKYQQIYSLFLFVINYAFPILLMALLYTRVILKLRKAGRNRHDLFILQSRSLTSSRGRQTLVERKFIRMTFLIMLVFVLCYLPYQVIFLLMHFEVMSQLRYGFILYDYAYLVTWIPNALNPVIYGKMDRYYSKAFTLTFRCLKTLQKKSSLRMSSLKRRKTSKESSGSSL